MSRKKRETWGTRPYFIHPDWLGTERVRTGLTGSSIETCTSLAYGDALTCSGTDVSPLHFTGQMHDNETGLDDFPARYYSSAQGRWYSPDWASAQVPVPYADLHNPQTLNLYDYVGSDPTNHADADGHWTTQAGTHEMNETNDYLTDGNGGSEEDATPNPAAEVNLDTQLQHASNAPDGAQQPQPQAAAAQAAQNTEVAQNQQPQQSQSNSSSDPNYKPGIPHATGELKKVLACTQSCTGKEFTVTSTNEAVKGHSDIHQPNTPHGRGEAADIRLPGGKADVGKALQCAANCGAKAAFDEYNHPSPHATGPHLHIQTVPTKSGGRGDLPEPED
jgi:RHS repeat-associated protein